MVDRNRSRVHGARALSGRARARTHVAQSDGRRGRRVGRAASSSGRARTSRPADRTPRSSRSTRPARARAAARSTARSSRAVTRDERARASSESSRRASRAWWRRCAIRTRACAAAASSVSARARRRGHDGVGADAARRQNAPFFTWVTKHRPFVTLKAAVSSDGFVGKPGTRTRLTGAGRGSLFPSAARGGRRDRGRARGRCSPTTRSSRRAARIATARSRA